ncbi:MAG: hypothetical protein EXQ69_03815 [Acidimicrobiia bacterium]|nr:hypothetical protein [Acidimicrobiia bacterium]
MTGDHGVAVQLPPSLLTSTPYEVTGRPPVSAGAAHFTVTVVKLPLVALATTFNGNVGTDVPHVTGPAELLAAEVTVEFNAYTRKRHAEPCEVAE